MLLKLIVVIIAGLIPMAPAAVYLLRERFNSPASATRGLIKVLKGANVVIALIIAGLALLWFASPQTVLAAGLTAPTAAVNDPYASIGAAIAAGIATLAAGIAVSNTGAAAVGAIAEKPETFGRVLVFVGLAEGIGIYGLIVAVLILNR